MTLNPDCKPGVVKPDPSSPGEYCAVCGCGWTGFGFASKTKAKAAQRLHRFPPRDEPEVPPTPQPQSPTDLIFLPPLKEPTP